MLCQPMEVFYLIPPASFYPFIEKEKEMEGKKLYIGYLLIRYRDISSVGRLKCPIYTGSRGFDSGHIWLIG